jgi:hypothetical protein
MIEDMDAHHPTWGRPGTKIDCEAETILEMMDEYNLVMTTEEGMVTWERKDQYSIINLIYISNNLFHRLVYTERADDIQHDSDHWPIQTVLGVSAPVKEPAKRRN